ncbi:MAG: hypothetical protein JNM33_11030 [Rubrivivax sp.]|nr:hypothetical protein [Rubrivivax sp.]
MSPPASPHRRAQDTELHEMHRRQDQADDLAAEHEARLDMVWKATEQVTVQIQELSGKFDQLERHVPAMVAQGIVAAVGDPNTWAAMRQGMRKSAEQAAGGWVMGTIKWAFDKALAGVVVLILVYSVGGLPALLAMLKLKGPTP